MAARFVPCVCAPLPLTHNAKAHDGLPGKIDNGAPSADFVVHQSVEQMVEALVRADVHMDTMSNKELGVEAHDVPADGDCMLHAWIKAAENVTGIDLPCFLLSLRALRERLAQFFEEHAQQLEAYHNKYGQWGWGSLSTHV